MNEENNEVINEVTAENEVKVEKKGNNNKGFLILFSILCVITIAFSTIAIVNDIKKEEKTEEGVGDIYSNIIKTMSESGTPNEEFSIKDIAALTKNSIVEISTETVVWGTRLGQYISEGGGSGIIISNDGYIVTNNHVIEDARKITVKLNSGESYEAEIIGTYSENDIAVLKIEATNLQPVVLGDSDKLCVGDTAVVVGNPLGSLGGTVTNGIISALDREIDLGDTKMNLLQTNAAVNPGNSGGGLFNGRGELVGIIVAKSAGSDIEGIGFAIPINDVKDDISELKIYGYKRGRVQLGVTLIDVSDSMKAMMYRLDSTGVYIQSVEDNSDADRAGIKVGDKVLSIDSQVIESGNDVKKAIQEKCPGDKISIKVMRNGREKKINVELTEYKGE